MKEKLRLWIQNSEVGILDKKYAYITHDSFDEFYNEVFYNKNSWMNLKVREKFKTAYFRMEELDLISYMKENHIGMVTFDEEYYPAVLRDFRDCPFGVFYRGDISIINSKKNLSVVGSRRCTRYGIDATEHIIKQLKGYDLNIISGMARGIDSVAHVSAMKNGLKTIAVLGSGIDVVYPKENKKLYDEIISEGGCVISEFSLGTSPISSNFPIRNRIISGLGDGLLVIEGGEKSGTLITVGTALSQGKSIVVVPGSIFSLESRGTNRLISEGATLYMGINDILDLLNISAISINNNKEMFSENKQKNKLEGIIDDNPIHIDNIIKLTDIDINQLYKLLFELQAKKEILCLSGNFYVRINGKKNTV
ncbi:MAG: DNA-processing protein DprA [Clostridium sp.]|nr:DNA-processing protein DprA [Clostridium sp.]MDU7083305.1 DNA-processing protein DprA [Clostridium sp.]